MESIDSFINETGIDVANRIKRYAALGQKCLCFVTVVSEQAFAGTNPEESFAVEHDRRHHPGFEALSCPDRCKSTGLRKWPSR